MPLYQRYVAFVIAQFSPDFNALRLSDFIHSQFPIVYDAIEGERGVQACTAAAHDMTCAFVERELHEKARRKLEFEHTLAIIARNQMARSA